MQGATHLDFANNRYWKDGELLTYAEWAASTTLSISVDTDATYFDGDGVMRTALANALRFDHDPATLAALGLLLEGARTNALTHASDLSNAAWTKVRTTVAADAVVAPDGSTSADNVLETAVTNTFHIDRAAFNITPGVAYCYSHHLHSLGRQYATLDSQNISAAIAVDLDHALILAQSGSELLGAGVQSVGGGWSRPWLSMIEASSTFTQPRFWINDLATDFLGSSHAGDITKGVTAWGGQFETGRFPSSYIQRVANAGARNADAITEAVANEAAGSVRLYFRTAAGTDGNQVLWQRDDGTESNRIRCVRDDTGNLHWIVTSGGADVVDIDLGVVSSSAVGYTDFRWADDDFGGSLNGGAETTATSGTVPSGLTTIRRGHNVAGTDNWFGHLSGEVQGVSKAGTAPFSIKIAYATDLHGSIIKPSHDGLYLEDGAAKLQAFVNTVNARSDIDCVVFGGDLTETYGAAYDTIDAIADLTAMVDILNTLTVPWHFVPGNHDFDKLTREQTETILGGPSGYRAFTIKDQLRVIILDSCYLADDDDSIYSAMIQPQIIGYINPAQRDWLTTELASTSLPVMVFIHHRCDGDTVANISNGPAVRAIFQTNRPVLVAQGHHHENDLDVVGSVPHVTMNAMTIEPAPATAWAIIDVYADRTVITGTDNQASWVVPRLS